MMFRRKVGGNMKFRRVLSAMLAAAVLAVGSWGCVAAFAEEEEPAAVEEKHEEPKEEKSEEPKEEKSEEPKEDKSEEPKEDKREESKEDQSDDSGDDNQREEPHEEQTIELGGDSDDNPEEETGKDDTSGQTEKPEEGDGSDKPAEETPTPTPDTTEVPDVSPEPSVTPEPTPQPGEAAISVKGSSAKRVYPGTQVTFSFSAQNVAELSYRIVNDGGKTVSSGSLDVNATSCEFTPTEPGKYTLVLTGKGLDGSEVSSKSSVTVEKLPELTVKVTANSECCHAGDETSFTLTMPAGLELASCSIVATQSGKQFYNSESFSEKVTVKPPKVTKVTKVTLTLKVKDIYGRTAEASATIPCAVHEREKRSHWEATMSGVVKTGVWPEDLIAIAKTQVGYKESSKDFGEKHGGGISGYTRYGDWAGMPYDEWCAMFASFCLHYAGIAEESFARASNCQRWIERLRKQDLYAGRSSYTPRVGDLVFFEWGSDNRSDHVGIIYKLKTDGNGNVKGFNTIEGNSKGGAVTDNDYYAINDGQVVGYGLVNTAYERLNKGTLVENTDLGLEEPVEETAEVELEETIVEERDVYVTANYDADEDVPDGATVEVYIIKPGDEGFDAYVDLMREMMDGDDELGEARFIEVRLVDGEGEAFEPESPVKLGVTYVDSLNASRALHPGVATIGGRDGIDFNPDVRLTRLDEGCRFEFEQADFEGVICTYVAGALKYKKNAVQAEDGDVSAKLAYDANSRVPAGTELNLREIKAGDEDYDLCLAHVDAEKGETVRLFEVSLALNGMAIDPVGEVTLSIACPEKARSVRVMRVGDDESFPAKLTRRKNGKLSVKFKADDVGIFALCFAEK